MSNIIVPSSMYFTVSAVNKLITNLFFEYTKPCFLENKNEFPPIAQILEILMIYCTLNVIY